MSDEIKLGKKSKICILICVFVIYSLVGYNHAYNKGLSVEKLSTPQIADNLEYLMNNVTFSDYRRYLTPSITIKGIRHFYNVYRPVSRPIMEMMAYEICYEDLTKKYDNSEKEDVTYGGQAGNGDYGLSTLDIMDSAMGNAEEDKKCDCGGITE